MTPRVRLFELPKPPGGAARAVPAFDPATPLDDPGRPRAGDFGAPGCSGERVLLAGAGLATTLQTPAVTPFERLYRTLPEQGIHGNVSPDRPFIIPLGAFRVPRGMAILIYDMRPDVYRFSGVDPNDFVPVEARRFQQITYDVVVNGDRRPGNRAYEIEPVPRQPTTGEFIDPLPPNTGALFPQEVFNRARVNQFGSAAGGGVALLPQRPTRYGALNAPFSLLLLEDEVFSARAVVIRPIQSPIAFIEFDFAGFLTPINMARDILACLHPLHGGPSS